MARYLDEIPVSEFEQIRNQSREIGKVFSTTKELGDTLDFMRDFHKERAVARKKRQWRDPYEEEIDVSSLTYRIHDLEEWLGNVECDIRDFKEQDSMDAHVERQMIEARGLLNRADAKIREQDKIIAAQVSKINELVEAMTKLQDDMTKITDEWELRLVSMEEQITRSGNKTFGAF